MLEFRDFVLQRGEKVLLNNASLRVERGNRVGLIGRNGAGKSSLLSVIVGQLEEDAGHIQCDIAPDRIAYLEQTLPPASSTAIDFAKSGDRQWQAISEQLLQAESRQDGIKIAQCHVRLHEIDGYTIDARAATILHGLGFCNADLTKRVGEFSGGWQMRLQLAKVLMSRADLLLLDEPTNHMDLEAVAWFEKWLLSTTCNVILISHDREFIDNVCTQIVHLAQEKLTLYPGNYTDFIRQFELQLEIQARAREKINKQKEQMQKFVDRFRYKATKARQAQSRLKAIEKLTIAPGVQHENPFHFAFMPCQRLSSPILNVEGDAGYGTKILLPHLDLSLRADDRIALLGLNGAGKSTLIKTLSGCLPLLSGEILSHSKLKIGYFSQQQLEALDYDSTPLAHMLARYQDISESEARRFLGGFDIEGNRVFDKVGLFSGGEKARLALALLIYQAPNLLLLDEPTNHLDIQMREALIFALQDYEGAVILVSHDRYFVNSVVDNLWLVAHAKVERFEGNLEDYQKLVLERSLGVSESQQPTSIKKKKPVRSNANPQKLIELERQIEQLSDQKQQLEEKLADVDLYQSDNIDTLRQIQANLAQITSALEEKEASWLKLVE